MSESIVPSDVDISSKYGLPHNFDPDFKGPVKKRSCTDVLCLLLFVAFLIGWIALSVLAFMNGDPERLLFPTDSRGRVCGRDEAVKEKPYLFFFDLTRCASPKVPFTGCPTPQVCVANCPSENWFYFPGETNKSRLICKEGTDLSKDTKALIEDGDCASYYIQSQNIAHRCIPLNLYNFTDELLDNVIVRESFLSPREKFKAVLDGIKHVSSFVRFQEVVDGVVQDIRRLWPFLLFGFVVAMATSFLWIVLLRFVATIMVWLSLIIFTALCGYASFYTLNEYLEVSDTGGSGVDTVASSSDTDELMRRALNDSSTERTVWLVLFLLVLTVFLICLVVFLFLRKRVTLAIALIDEASKAVGNIYSTLFFPVIPYLMHLVFIVFFCVVAILLASTGVPVYRVVCDGDCSCSPLPENSTCFPANFSTPSCLRQEASCAFYSYEKHPVLPSLQVYNVFALFWTMFFVSAFCEMVLAGTFSSWYWSFNKTSDLPPSPVLNSLKTTCRYHLGTVAFGALIIAIVRVIRLLFEYIDHKVKQYSNNAFVKAISCCCRCCLWCLEKFLRFVNRNAYIYTAIYGTNFCVSARNSFSMIMRNVIRVFVLDKVTDFLLLIGKLVITFGMAFLAYFFFSGKILELNDYLPHTRYYLTPVVIIGLGSFFIASAFFDVYNMAVDTLFFCFLEDSERNDGSKEKPYYMSKNLMKILNKSNRFKETTEGK